MTAEQALDDTSFDYIVLGTGVIESVLAGALARAGQKVLHADRRHYYGGEWASFALDEWIDFLSRKQLHSVDEKTSPLALGDHGQFFDDMEYLIFPTATLNEETMVDVSALALQIKAEEAVSNVKAVITEGLSKHLTHVSPGVSNLQQRLIGSSAEKITSDTSVDDIESILARLLSQLITLNQLLKDGRSFSIDVCSKLLLSRGDMHECLIDSGSGTYLEFKQVDRIFIAQDNTIRQAPCSREDIFASKELSLGDKRRLMSALTTIGDLVANLSSEDPAVASEALQSLQGKTFAQFLTETHKLNAKLAQTIQYVVADPTSSIGLSAVDGIRAAHTFMKSFGRYGSFAYICPMYGNGSELAQAFSRVCAVHGGTYILDLDVTTMLAGSGADSNSITGIRTAGGQELRSKAVIASADMFSRDEMEGEWISSAVVITSSPIFPNALTDVIVFPPGSVGGNVNPVVALQLSDFTKAAPEGKYVLHVRTVSSHGPGDLTAKDDLLPFLQTMISSEQPSTPTDEPLPAADAIFFFKRFAATGLLPGSSLLSRSGFHVAPSPSVAIEYSDAVAAARNIFEQLLPGVVFNSKPADAEVSQQQQHHHQQHELVDDLDADL
ncbi:rab protein geranylgeranyltransferase component A [Ramicandelaber brevisporus]|nr:rab protein geranylgeranyltransferase component A [Ramicandelaber brevisporus]